MRYHFHLLQACSEALTAIFFEDRYADKCIEFYLKRNRKWGSRDRRFFAETVYDCVRWWRLYFHLLNREASANDIQVVAVSLWRRNMPIPEFSEFRNMDTDLLQKRWDKLDDPAIASAIPDWLFARCEKELGDDWVELLPYLNTENNLVIRANTQKISLPELQRQLVAQDFQLKSLSGTSTGFIFNQRPNVFRTEQFKNGFFEVQDGSSQQVASYLQLEPGQRVIDACAGAGGKTLHMADLMQSKGRVTALDIHQWKLDQLKLRSRRNGYSNVETKVIDGTKTIKRLKESADRLLLDVPCSGLGVLRRNPDTKWKLTEERLSELNDLQKTIIQDYSSMLKPGGLMVYATCSILPSENQDVVAHFLAKNPQFELLKQRTIYPVQPGYDGFFMALLHKKPVPGSFSLP